MTPVKDRHVQLAILIGLVAVGIRFIAINQPFVDEWSWRQSDVAAIARNFFHGGFHFAYPQIDWAGDQPGYVGTEFPILPFLAGLSFKLFGVHEWVGRSQGVVLFAASLPFFFLLVRELFDAATAAWALFFYSFAPLGMMASRSFIPDLPSLALSIVGLYFFRQWCLSRTAVDKLDGLKPSSLRRASIYLFGAAVAISMAILVKAPTAIIGVPLAVLALQRFGVRAFRRIELWIFAVIALVPSGFWYWHAHRIAEKYYPHHFFGAGGIKIENLSWYWNIATGLWTTGLTPPLFLVALIGLIVAPRANKSASIFKWWLAAMLLFFIVVGYGNRHPWYQLPLVPLAAVFAGVACVWLRTKLHRLVVPLIASITLIWFLIVYSGLVAPVHEPLRLAGLALQRVTTESDLVVAANYGDPNIFYYAERKGWHLMEDGGIYNGHPINSADAIAEVEQLRKRGATYLVFYSGTFWWLEFYKEFAQHVDLTATLVEATPQFRIYKLK